jgi:diguanylate cyclase (GGDEF)-like protein
MQTFTRPSLRPVPAKKPHNSYSQVLELLSNLSRSKTEDEAIREIIHVFSIVFQPNEIIYIALQSDLIVSVRPHETPPDLTRVLIEQAKKINPELHSIERSTRPIFPITSQGETYGIISLTFGEMISPEQHFYDIGQMLAVHSGVVISNLRARSKVKEDDRLLQKTDFVGGLTGVSSRRYFFEIAEAEFRRSKRYNRPLSAILVDIDNFKTLNDKYGSETGCHVLAELSRIFNKELRESDIRVRMGGEELLMLLPETTLRYSHALAHRLLRRITEMPFEVCGVPVIVTISLGVVGLDKSIKTLEEFINGCDQALAQAKRLGTNQVSTWAPPVKEYEAVYVVRETDYRIGFY